MRAALNVSPSVETIDVVELEPEVIEANRRLADIRDVDPLADPWINVVINNARNANTPIRYLDEYPLPSHE